MDIYGKGWSDGYNDLPNNNPYEPGTDEYNQYEEGFEQGSRDC